MRTVKVGNQKFQNEDLVAAACGNAQLALDAASLEKCNYEAIRFSKDYNDIFIENLQELFPLLAETKPDSSLPEILCRSSVVARICAIMQGRLCIRGDIPQLLVNLLNAGVCPLIPTDSKSEGASLICSMMGKGLAYYKGEIKAILEASKEAAVELLTSMKECEIETVKLRSYAEVGSVCLASASAVIALDSYFGALSLSLEASRAFTESFQSVHFDICRQHRGQMETAERLRLMLAGSKLVDSRCKSQIKGDEKSTGTIDVKIEESTMPLLDNDVLRCVPQYFGPAAESIQKAYKTAEIELNSSEAGPLSISSFSAGPFNLQQVQSAAFELIHSIQILIESSRKRYAIIEKGSLSVGCKNAYKPETFGLPLIIESESYITKLHNMLHDFQKQLLEEYLLSISILVDIEEKRKKENEEKKIKATMRMTEKKEKIGECDAGLSSEQLAKRREKAAHNAAQKAKKAATKGKVDDSFVMLGDGTSELMNKVLANLNESKPSPEVLASKLDPYNFCDTSIGSIVSSIINRLTSGGSRRKPKLPKGTRDQNPEQMVIREQVFEIIRNVFKRHGAVEIDTPVFELKSTLSGKYGEDQKLIYELADQGGELLALRYDLTVPFARYLAMNNSIGNMRRYHIAKVYRRDQPNMQKGRYREFYQCDFDISGTYGSMVPDAEVLSVACEILSGLPIGDFQVKLNHRRLLDAIMDICGCPSEKFRTICSAIDKLDKASWEDVRREMVEEKGLAPNAADQIGTFVTFHGPPRKLWDELTQSKKFGTHPDADFAMMELKVLFDYLEAMDMLKFIEFDLSLARGLTYYTGLIYECVVIDSATKVGSIAAGGRYDNLVGMFSATQTPCVGVSIGIERIFAIMEAKAKKKKNATNIQVYVAGVGPNLLPYRMTIAKHLWDADIPTEFNHQIAPKLKPQLTEVLEREIPFMVIVGEDEMAINSARVKDMVGRTEDVVEMKKVVDFLKAKGCRTVKDSLAAF